MQILDIGRIRENHFINRFDWYSLNCLERTKCIVSECIMKNSAYIYLLFMGINGWYLSEDNRQGYEEFVEEKTQITFELVSGEKDRFIEDLKGFIMNEEYIILISDNMYREGTDAYGRHHHEHFLILKGFDPESDSFIVVDEDMSGEYHIPANCADGVIYRIQALKADYLKELCCFDYKTIWGLRNTDASLYKCFKAVRKPDGPAEYGLDGIKRMYREHIEHTILRLPGYISLFKGYIAQTKEQHDDIYVNNFINYPEYFKAWIVFPGKSETISKHFFCLHTQRRFFELKMKESEMKALLLKAFDETVDMYFRIRNLILKCLIANDKSVYGRIIACFDDIYPKELALYNMILEYADHIFLPGDGPAECAAAREGGIP